MTIREAKASDRPELVRLRAALWPDSEEAEVDDATSSKPSDGVVLVAERPRGGLAGFAEVALRKFADGCRSSPVAYLEGIWIDTDARRAGVASALVHYASSWARSRGLHELGSDCEVGNRTSEAFHLAAGFQEVQRSISFRLDLGNS